MGTPLLPDEERRRRKEAVESALRDGYAPFRVNDGRGSSVSEAARRLGIPRNKVADFIRREEQQASIGEPNFLPDWSLFSPDAPEVQPQSIEERTVEQALRDEITRLRAELRASYRASAEEDAIL